MGKDATAALPPADAAAGKFAAMYAERVTAQGAQRGTGTAETLTAKTATQGNIGVTKGLPCFYDFIVPHNFSAVEPATLLFSAKLPDLRRFLSAKHIPFNYGRRI